MLPTCSGLEQQYPHFPSELDFIHRLLAYGELEQHSEGGELNGLSQFAQRWKSLQAGGLLLPDLVEFYQWLHTQLGECMQVSWITLPVDPHTGVLDHLTNVCSVLA